MARPASFDSTLHRLSKYSAGFVGRGRQEGSILVAAAPHLVLRGAPDAGGDWIDTSTRLRIRGEAKKILSH
jgi:hypothetical protein